MHQLNRQLRSKTARFPRNVAIGPNGNGRWAAQRGLSAMEGHLAGGEVAFKRVRGACELGIELLALFGFSTENWARAAAESRD